MNGSPRIRLGQDKVAALLAGEAVEATFRGPKCPARGGSYPVTLQEPTKVRAVVAGSKLRPGCLRVWTLTIVLDRTEAPLLLNAESKGGVIVQLSDDHSESEPAAHGYVDTPGRRVLDAGDAVPHGDVETFAESQAAARRFAADKVDKLAKRRAKSLGNRVQDALMKARAHGADPNIEALETWLKGCEDAAKEAA